MSSAAEQFIYQEQSQDSSIRKKSRIAALLALLFWILILGIPIFSYTFPPPEKPGILMAFGDIDGGGDEANETAITDADAAESNPDESAAPQKDFSSDESKKEATVKSPPSKLESETDDYQDIETAKKSVENETPVINPNNNNDDKTNDADKIAQDEAAQKAKRDAEEQARKEKEAAKKKEFSDLFTGSGSGSEPQKQGDPDGEPDAKKLDGITSGTGKIGEGLKDRGVLYEPDIDENSQKVGRIVVRVCVNGKGLVTEANYTQRGSTSTDLDLIKVAEEAAAKYRFSPSGLDKQCGSISIDFKLQ